MTKGSGFIFNIQNVKFLEEANLCKTHLKKKYTHYVENHSGTQLIFKVIYCSKYKFGHAMRLGNRIINEMQLKAYKIGL